MSEPRSTPHPGWIAVLAAARQRTRPPAFFLFYVQMIHQVKTDFSERFVFF